MLLLERININKSSGPILGSDILDHYVSSSFCPKETGSTVKCCHVRESVQLEFVSGLSELQMFWRKSHQWKRGDCKSISGSVTDFFCHSMGKLLGPGFQKSSSRYLASWFWRSFGLCDVQLLMLHILSLWLLQNSAACPINTEFEYEINILFF